MAESAIDTLDAFSKNPGQAAASIPERRPVSGALAGYLAGSAGLAVWLGFGTPYGSLFGFAMMTAFLFAYNLTAGFISSSMASMFLSLAGKDRQAGSLFLLTGISEACKLTLIPLGILAAALPALRTPAFLLALAVQYCFIIFAVDRIYSCGKTKAAIATLLPFVFFSMLVTLFILFIAVALFAALISALA